MVAAPAKWIGTYMPPLQAAAVKSIYSDAMRLKASGRQEEALRAFGSIIESNPQIAEPHFQVARIYIDADQPDRALKHLRAASALKPAEAVIWETWASAVALSGRADAEQDFLSALKKADIPASLRVRLQDRFGPYRRRQFQDLPTALRKNIEATIGFLASGRPAEAERNARSLLARHPGTPVLHNILGSAQQALGHAEDALRNYLKAVAIDRTFAEAHKDAGTLLLDLNRVPEALPHLKSAVVLSPNMAPALSTLAVALSRAGATKAALPLAEKAVRLQPRMARTHIALGNVLTRLKDHVAAEIAFTAAVKADPNRADALALLGQAQSRLGQDNESMASYDRALELAPDLPLAVGGKAALLQTLGRFDEAERCFRKVFELDPSNGENYRLFIASHKTKPDDPIIPAMRDAIRKPGLSDADKVNFGFAIAKAMEDTKDYSSVFSYLDPANALARKLWPYDISRRIDDIAAVKSSLGPTDWQRALTDAEPDAPSFAPIFVTGMPRSGTTLIEQIIASHSQVEGAGEVGASAGLVSTMLSDNSGGYRPFATVTPGELQALAQEYEAILRARCPGAERITDKSIQSYLFIGPLKLALPKSRFIVVRRDPRDNLLSIYKNKFPEGTHLYAYDQRDLATYYDTFVEMIEFWRERVPDWFYEVQYEELVANPEEETRKLIAACGLEWEDACLSFHENKRKVETLSVYQVRQPITKASVALWQRYEEELRPMLDALKEAGHVPG